jgi:tol-pal system-associated acyl-CoA thioesterase
MTDAALRAPPVAEPFAFPVRVYYEDTDAGGVVYYANFLKFMERARSEWLAALGSPLADLERTHGATFVVHHVTIEFRRPARLNDALQATVEVLDRGASRLVLRQTVRRAADILTDATVKLACVTRSGLRPRRMPAALAAILENLH